MRALAWLLVVLVGVSHVPVTAAFPCSSKSDCGTGKYCYDDYIFNDCRSCYTGSYPCTHARSYDGVCCTTTPSTAPARTTTTAPGPPGRTTTTAPGPPGRTTTTAPGMCDKIAGDLPSACQCAETRDGFRLQCSLSLPGGIDTVGVEVEILPCGDPASLSAVVTESDLGIDYNIADISAGDDENIPIPGLTLGIPIVGNVQGDAVIKIDGKADHLEVNFGLDACGVVWGVKECGSDLSSSLPVGVLQGAWDFSTYCQAKRGRPTTVIFVAGGIVGGLVFVGAIVAVTVAVKRRNRAGGAQFKTFDNGRICSAEQTTGAVSSQTPVPSLVQAP